MAGCHGDVMSDKSNICLVFVEEGASFSNEAKGKVPHTEPVNGASDGAVHGVDFTGIPCSTGSFEHA